MLSTLCSRKVPLQLRKFGSTLSVFFRRNQASKAVTNSASGRSDAKSGSGTGSGSVANLSKDIIIFKYENPRFYRYLNLFAISQFGFWTYLSSSALTLINVEPSKEVAENDDLPFWRKINLGEAKYRHGLALAYAGLGFAILCASWIYILRSVRFIILRKDAATAALVTYTPFGQNRILNVPMDCISAAGSRTSGKSYIPIRLKNKKFFYLVDSKGEFPRPGLFDTTVGVHRKFPK